MSSEIFRKWRISYEPPALRDELTAAGYNPLLALVLAYSGCTSVDDADALINGGDELIHDPFEMKGMAEAVARINAAIKNNEKVVVYGDYDVDGITSTCLLRDYLCSRGLDCIPYIPNRNDEGYGLNCAALDQFKGENVDLVITVDCGITAIDEAEHAKELGIDMVITDHHECKDNAIPDVCAVVDTKQAGDTYQNRYLAGVGVAFKLACACSGNSTEMLNKYADLVAVGTIADVMPLLDENRVLVRKGLQMLRRSPRPGFLAALKEAGVDPKTITASTISYTIAPRLNAAGRLGEVDTALELVMCEDDEKAAVLASRLSELNRQRQSIETDIWHEAAGLLSGENITAPIVLAKEKWNQGVIGIAASRLAEQYSLPTIMISINENGIGKGSCRSFGDFNLFEALSACSHHLISYGGHALAAGLNIEGSKVDAFRKALADYYFANKPAGMPEIDCGFVLSDASILTTENVRSLDKLEPFGNANPKPQMCLTGATLDSIVSVGNGKHLKLKVTSGPSHFDAIFFSHSKDEFDLHAGDLIDIAFTPQINTFRGTESVQLAVSALRKFDTSLCEDILANEFNEINKERLFCPERPDFVKIWRSFKPGSMLGSDIDNIIEGRPKGMSPEKYCLCLMVLKEAGLFSGRISDMIFGSVPVFSHEKRDLEATVLLKRLRSTENE